MIRFQDLLKEKSTYLYTKFKKIKDEAPTYSAHGQILGDTDNGLKHIEDVENKIDRLIPDDVKDKFEPIELYILLAAIYLHDIGRIKSTIDHPESSKKIIDKIYNNLDIPNGIIEETIGSIVSQHGSNKPIDLEKNFYIDNCGTIHPKFIAAILRLGDELSSSYVRAPEYLKKIYDDKEIDDKRRLMSEKWVAEWEEHYKGKWDLREKISGVDFNINDNTIEIYVMHPPQDSKGKFEKLKNDLESILRDYRSVFKDNKIDFDRVDIKYLYTEVEKVTPEREDLTKEEWQEFYKNANKRIYIMGQSMWGVFEKNEEIIKEKLKDGKDIRVILLNPYYNSQQLEKVNRELSPKDLNLAAATLKDKIKKTINKCIEIQKEATKNNYEGKLLVKVTNDIIYCSLSIVDDKMYVNSYSNNPKGDKCPLLLLTRDTENKSALFDFYENEFESMWKNAEYPQNLKSNVNYRIYRYSDHIKNIKDSQKSSLDPIPPPKMAIIYITYKCSSNCPSCMYKKIRETKHNGNTDMEVKLFKHILDDLVKNNVESIELSGGGEPLEHEKINEIIETVAKIKEEHDCKFGLLTNGLELEKLDEEVLKQIINNFEYVRISFPEIIDNKDIEKKIEYIANLRYFVKKSKLVNPSKHARIGAKILLTDKNMPHIHDYLEEIEAIGVDHIKIKSVRGNNGPSPEEIYDFEDKLYAYKLLDKEELVKKREDLQIDIHETKFPKNFECWINPLFTTIDPEGKVFICYNYHNNEKKMEIGQYDSDIGNTLDDFWGNENHKQKIKEINVKKICMADNACNCRFVYYQKIIEDKMQLEMQLEKLIFPNETTTGLSDETTEWYNNLKFI